MEMDNFSNLLEDYPPNYTEYFTYPELIERMNGRETLSCVNIGKSTNHTDMFAYEIGSGSIKALIYGLPHSDEPIGTLTVDMFANLVLEHKELLQYFTFLLIPCIDPDGLAMNEGWLKGEFSTKKFFLNRFHRPDEEDIDWSFPVKTKYYEYDPKISETSILKNLIHKFKPDLFTTLHSIQFSGIHFYFSNNYITLFNKIEEYIESSPIPLQKGTPFFIEEDWTYRPGFYRIYTTKEMINDYIREGMDISTLRRGEFSAGYFLQNFPRKIALVPEMPLYYDNELNNLEKGNKTKKETFLESNRIMLETLDYIEPIWEEYKTQLDKKNPHYLRIKEITENWRKEIKEEMKITKKEGSLELATRSEIYSNESVVKYNSCNTLGALYQLIKNSGDMKKKPQQDILDRINSKIDLTIEDVESSSNIEISDINEMVKIQTFSILATLDYLRKKKSD